MSPQKRDFVAWRDLPAAVGLLSRLPVPVDGAAAQARGAAAAWAWPLAGVVLGALAALVASVALWVGLPASLAAALALTCLIVTAGAMHEDGLADCADGFWGGWERDRRLEIMKDSRIGAYGVIALGLSLLVRWQALSLIIEAGLLWPAMVAAAALSRAGMVALMAGLPPARGGGLSRSVGQPEARTLGLAVALAGGLSLALLGFAAVPVMLTVAVLGLGWAAICRAKIGGQTGDTLGAVQQIGEIGALLAITASVTIG